MLLLLIFAFISGLVTILAPCIWPLLPIILSSSATHPGTAVNPQVKVFLDGHLTQTISITDPRLYTLVDQTGTPEDHSLRLEFSGPGIEVYAFTFG